MPTYLQKRRRLWYAILEIPEAVRPLIGKRRYLQSLNTDSRTIAERRVLPIIFAWRSEITKALEQPNDDAAFFRRSLRNAKTTEHKHSILEQIDMAAWKIGDRKSVV